MLKSTLWLRMMRTDDFNSSKGRGTKVHLFLDGEYAATTDENCWLDNYISNGADIDDEQWQALLVKINYKKR